MADSRQSEAPVHRDMMEDAAAAVLRHWREMGKGTIAISRATWLRNALAPSELVTIPVVAGQTVWREGAPAAVAVIEQPNWLGRIERQPIDTAAAITVLWWTEATAFAPGPTIDACLPVGAVNVARNLAGQLRQIRGLALPHNQPESPWFVVGLPTNASDVAERLTAAGFPGCEPVGLRFPEFPGGLRIEVAWPTTANALFAETVRKTVER